MRIVIKLGTSTLTHATGHLNIRRVELLRHLEPLGHGLQLLDGADVREEAVALLHRLQLQNALKEQICIGISQFGHIGDLLV